LEYWQPTFYCAADPGALWTSQEIDEYRLGLPRVMPRAFFFHLSAKHVIQEHSLVPRHLSYFIDAHGPWGSWSGKMRPWELTGMVPHVRTTAHMALLIALYLGCSPIYLIGLDHDWLAHRSVETHFYQSRQQDIGSSADLGTYSYKTMVENTVKTWDVYE